MSESSTIDIRAPCLAVLEPTDTFVSNSHENSQGNFSNSSSPTIEAGSSQSHMETLNVPVSEELLSPARQDEPEDVFHATDFRSFTRRTLNWIGQFFDENSTYRRQALWPIIFFSFIYVGACIVASVTILCLTWNKPCDEPLKYWVLFNGVISLLYTIFKRLSNEDLVDDYSQLTSIQQRSLICFRIISWLSLAWFIVGMVWVFRCETCQRTAVALYRLSLALVIINLIFLGVSVLLACCIFVLAPNLFRPDFNLDGSVTFHRRGATKKEIDRILLVRYHRDSSEEESTCPICLCEYEEGNLLRILPCTSKHRFHATCVDRWLILNKSCPLCKAEIDASSRCAGGTSRSDNV
ncbi:zinc finger (C3HC4-type RING finger) family protein [Galdieria sulphuraria]|uniref:Zinc finger (C3HC4-type RING finger) family protein n=1 Tax=Galdieria sulphuraria TaxID=130081 RepID=M2Y6W2_GALSU|nr:zinc finger (C3HC4-type RING finger) family protein [Galdieria sulphuraria]EME31773.1 zinc finger (C3HC4-type RING finger) family protein [Galdieria sulphuraria]|eukprot:XP_005708293.1 zinc finger (C3HC4-type RING finger) family protein [Galdieria sulphuraria]